MKTIPMLSAIVLALSGAAAFAQSTQGGAILQPVPMDTQTPMTRPVPPMAPTTPMTTTPDSSATSPQAAQTPPPIIVDTKVDLTSEPGPPADMHAAREEAVNALQWAKTEGCKSDPSPRECVRQAQDDYRATMSRLGQQRGR